MCVVVNLWGGPGCGKSTTMAAIFAELKIKGYNVEMVSEFAKDLVYEKRDETMKDELYIFAKQNHRLFRVKDKVDVIVTDRPLPLTCVYDEVYGKNDRNLHTLVRRTFQEYDNINILLDFNENNYKKEGRLQTKEEALNLHHKIVEELKIHEKNYLITENNKIKDIINYIEERLKEPIDWNNVLLGTYVYVKDREEDKWIRATYLCFDQDCGDYKHFVYLPNEKIVSHYKYAKLELDENEKV